MNAPDKLPLPAPIEQRHSTNQALALFPLEGLQHLNKESALRCQMMLGHGDTYGIWVTPESMIQNLQGSYRRIDLRKRIAAFLPEEIATSSAVDVLLDEGVLWLTRLCLLMRMGPAGVGRRAKLKPLDASTVTDSLYKFLTKLVALGAVRRLEITNNSGSGFVSSLSNEDLSTLLADDKLRPELMRMTQLEGLGLWTDVSAAPIFKGKTTAVRGARSPSKAETKKNPFPAIPDDYLAAMGPRVLWLIKDLGPNLIHMLETLPAMLGAGSATTNIIQRRITRYFETYVWRDSNGQVIEKPPFDLFHTGDRGKHRLKDQSQYNPFQWPPKHWTSVQTLAVTLQSAHLWIALLVMAARIGEVATLGRNCVEFAQDGQPYTNGRTYKASRTLEGEKRDWAMPDILVDVFAQQIKLVEASARLARTIQDSVELADLLGDSTHLWASLGATGRADATKKLERFGENLRTLASRIGLTPTPGGKNLHPHRFRKTMARLAGLAIDGSQKVLMLLLGHDDVTTTLGYMQSDPAFAKELDDITRELRIIRGEALINDMRAALFDSNSLPYAGHGGGGATILADSVRAYEEELHRSGQEWGVNTARELAVLLTNNGESARLISAHVICTKTAGEVGLCSSKKGAIVAGNCQVECRNHIEDKTGRRDTERVIPIIVQHAQENIANNDWLPLQSAKKQLEQELKRYNDIGEEWRSKPEVAAILRAGE